MELNYLKNEYEKLAKKHKLPSFAEINFDFEIDKLDKEMDSLLRAVRKLMMEKIVNSINFLEMLINPVSVPRMYLSYIKSMGIDDRKIIEELYTSLAQLTFSSLDLEIESSEEGEAKLIKKVFTTWRELKPDFKSILDNMKNPKMLPNKKERSYFG